MRREEIITENFLNQRRDLNIQVQKEEQRLENDFGNDYVEYKRLVNRFFPH